MESEDLNGYLTERALTMIEKSKDIPESLFKRFLARVSGVTSQNILAKLAKDGPAVEEAVLDPDLLAFEPQAADDLEILGEIGFVQEGDDHKFRITTEGTQFLHTIKGEVR